MKIFFFLRRERKNTSHHRRVLGGGTSNEEFRPAHDGIQGAVRIKKNFHKGAVLVKVVDGEVGNIFLFQADFGKGCSRNLLIHPSGLREKMWSFSVETRQGLR